MDAYSVPMFGAAGEAAYLRSIAKWIRTITRKRVRLNLVQEGILLGAINGFLQDRELSPEAGQRLASLFDEFAAQATIQAAAGADQHINGKV